MSTGSGRSEEEEIAGTSLALGGIIDDRVEVKEEFIGGTSIALGEVKDDRVEVGTRNRGSQRSLHQDDPDFINESDNTNIDPGHASTQSYEEIVEDSEGAFEEIEEEEIEEFLDEGGFDEEIIEDSENHDEEIIEEEQVVDVTKDSSATDAVLPTHEPDIPDANWATTESIIPDAVLPTSEPNVPATVSSSRSLGTNEHDSVLSKTSEHGILDTASSNKSDHGSQDTAKVNIPTDAPSSKEVPKPDDPAGCLPAETDATVVIPSPVPQKTKPLISDPPELKPPIAEAPLEDVLIDPPDSPTLSSSIPTGDELMGIMSEKSKKAKVSFQEDKLPPALASLPKVPRPFDEYNERDDPTDEEGFRTTEDDEALRTLSNQNDVVANAALEEADARDGNDIAAQPSLHPPVSIDVAYADDSETSDMKSKYSSDLGEFAISADEDDEMGHNNDFPGTAPAAGSTTNSTNAVSPTIGVSVLGDDGASEVHNNRVNTTNVRADTLTGAQKQDDVETGVLAGDPGRSVKKLNEYTANDKTTNTTDKKYRDNNDSNVFLSNVNVAPTDARTMGNDVDKDDSDYSREENARLGMDCKNEDSTRRILVCLICLFFVILVVVLGVTLRDDDDSRDIDVPEPSPAAPTIAPKTSQPSPFPTPDILLPSWVEAVPSVNGEQGSGFGAAIAMDKDFIAVGSPNTSSVSPFLSIDGQWNILNILVGDEPESKFGYSLDIVGTRMAVGAPFRTITNTFVEAGSVYVYEYSAGGWTRLGLEIVGEQDVFAANEEFGYSVAVANNGITQVAVGAPKNNVGDISNRGRVYTFSEASDGSNVTWERMGGSSEPLVGASEYDWFGASIDMSRDGSRIIIGAPGNGTGFDGYVQIYFWSGSEWTLEFEKAGVEGEGFGSSVLMLSDSGNQFAVGASRFQDGAGKISVFELQETRRRRQLALTEQLGEDIIGMPEDQLGVLGSFQGRAGIGGIGGIIIIFSTASGVVKTQQFNAESRQWKPILEDLETDNRDVVLGFSDTLLLAVGSPSIDEMTIYKTDMAPSSPPETASSIPPEPTEPSKVETASPAAPPSSETAIPGAPSALETTIPGASSVLETTVPGAPSALETASPGSFTTSPSFTLPGARESGSPGTPQTIETASPGSSPAFETDIPGPASATPVPSPSVAVESESPIEIANFTQTPISDGLWDKIGGPFTPRETGWGYGSSLALTTSHFAIGAPLAVENGAVFGYESDGNSDASVQLFGESAGDRYGASIDMTDDLLVVGAPFALSKAGYVYCYARNGLKWVLGSTLQGTSDSSRNNEQFGSSVAVSDTRIVVVGAQGNSLDGQAERGRVYVFSLGDGASGWSLLFNVPGLAPQGRYGSVVDISSDGSVFIAGAPGTGAGYFTVFEWSGSEWISVLLVQGEEGEALGSSVKVLTPDGSFVAVGAPGHNGNEGKVSVYEKNGRSYTMLGNPIIGAPGDILGASGTMSGGGASSPSVICGTATGDVKRFDFDSTVGEWLQVGDAVKTGYSALLQVVSSSAADQFIVSGNDDVAVYGLL